MVEYEVVSTGIEGVELRVLKEQKPTVPEEIVQLFLELARAFAKAKKAAKAITADQKERRAKLIKFVKAVPGWRGIRSTADDLNLLVVRREETSWDRDLLKASLGVAYDTLVSEELVATVMIPPGLVNEPQLREGLTRLLTGLKVPEEDVVKLLAVDVELRIDTEKLEELAAASRVKLLPGTKEIEEDWAVEAEPLKTPQERRGKQKGEDHVSA